MNRERAETFIRFLDEYYRLRGRIALGLYHVYAEDLTQIEVVVLNAVAGAAQPPTVPQIGRSLGHARQVIQRAATSLMQRGLITTVHNPDHKRAHRLVPTDLGRAAKRQADLEGLKMADRMTEGLGTEVIENGRAALQMIREVLEKNIPQAGPDGDQES
jgi:DNA-binding MarR family transcriptional regulator